jgi:glycosyltransferase involved in cell wall biosynthesis
VFVESPPPTLAIPGWLASRAHKATLVLNVADLWPDSATSLGLAKPGPLLSGAQMLEQWAYRRADAVTAVTDGIRDTLVTRKGVPASRVLFLPNGVDTNLFMPAPYDEQLAQRLGIAGRKIVMLAGSLGYGAGLDVILDAAESVQDRPITFLIVGGGSEYERLVAAIASRSLDNVRMLGPRPLHEIAELYSVTDIGLMTLVDSPLFAGTRPARVYPAMASAKPIIYCGFGEGADLIEQAGAGIVVPPANAPALANAVCELLGDDQRSAEMGRRGRAYVEANLSWDHLIQDWLHALKSVLPG